MSGLELAAISLSTIIVKNAAKIWMGDHEVASDISSDAIDIISAKATTIINKRQVSRTFDQMVDAVAKNLTPYIDGELKNLPENEKAAAIFAVVDTFKNVPLSDNYLFSNDLNASYIDRYLRSKSPQMPQKALLSEAAEAFYYVLLHESCEYLVQVTLALPQFQPGAIVELLRRSTELVSEFEEVLSKLPRLRDDREVTSFSVDYRRQVINQLDRMELFGASLSETSRRYPLSVAYISLNLSPERDDFRDAKLTKSPDAIEVAAEHALDKNKRLFIRGEAGSGKTTLLKWIAVRSAFQDFPSKLNQWNSMIPFFLPLRRYVESGLPSLDSFPVAVGRFISEDMPPGYVLETLRSGHAAVLIDGLDEFPLAKRDEVRAWLSDLISSFPEAKYVVTSRPGAVAPGWLGEENFVEFELLPMALTDIRAFITHWHESMRANTSDADERSILEEFENQLIERITARRHLRVLAETPLLCALLCALHRDRRGQLPHNRMELYDVALEMLLERRDAERHVLADTTLSRTEKTLFLQDIAYWLIRNGWSDAEKSQVISRIGSKLSYMSQITADPTVVYQHLLERSGLIREPVAGRVDFVHRTFQEYLASLDALAANDIGLLVDRAHLDQWREVVIMAAGHAFASKREELLKALVERGDNDPEHRDELHLLAVACLETSPELSQELRSEIRARVVGLLPPKNVTAAKSLASAGEFVVDLLAQSKPRLATEVAATIRAAAEIGTDSSLRIIQNYRNDNRATVYKQIIQAWAQFDAADYARQVLAHNRHASSYLYIGSKDLIEGLRHLPQLRKLRVNVRRALDLKFLRWLPELDDLIIENSPVINATEIKNCKNLEQLGLNSTDIDDLSGISSLEKLVGLSVQNSQVTDLAPLRNLSRLEQLALYNTPAENIEPLENLSKLTYLDLEGTKVTDIKSLRKLTNISILDIRGLGISDLRPMASLTNLRRFYALNIRAQDASALANLKELEVLHLTNVRLHDINFIAGLEGVTHFLAQNAPFEDITPLSRAANLEVLNLRGTGIRDLTPLAELRKLSELDISSTGVTDLSPLKGIKSLRTLRASMSAIKSIDALRGLPRLTTLDVSSTGISDISVVSEIPKLGRLFIARTAVEDLGALENTNIIQLRIDWALKSKVPAAWLNSNEHRRRLISYHYTEQIPRLTVPGNPVDVEQ